MIFTSDAGRTQDARTLLYHIRSSVPGREQATRPAVGSFFKYPRVRSGSASAAVTKENEEGR
eukprot:1684637-Prymnesium_polylepis.2